MNLQRINDLIDVYQNGLLNDTLKFWFPRVIDEKHGGYMIARDRDGSLLDTDKGVWQQGRTAWLLGNLYNTIEQRDDWLNWCQCGIDFMDKHCFDPTDGRMWFHVTQDGKPIRKRRYAFSEAFAAIAYGEYAKATNSDHYATKAKQTFLNFVEQSLNPKDMTSKFTDVRPTQGIGFPMICIAVCQELRQSINLDIANQWIDRSIETIQTHFVKDDLQVVMETVGPNGEIYDHFDGRTLNPGHAIEGAWFIMHEGKHRNDNKLIQLGCKMLDWMWQRGWDTEYGGMLYFRDLYDKPVQEYWHDMKFWWPQNETIIATLLAHHLTGDEKYEQMHQQAHDWAHHHFPDKEHGEWYGYLHRDGRVSVPLKGNLWKGPFHMPRMQWYCWQLLEEMKTKIS